jgi:predicted lysophospholipase L1 biosynthesis ABC-type transport system permease subunit
MEEKNLHKDLQSIRQLMERSVIFLSLSGLSGILAGSYALAGAITAYLLMPSTSSPFHYPFGSVKQSMPTLLLIAILVLAASLITGYLLAERKAKRLGANVWDSTSKRLVINLAVPLAAGGIFILALWMGDHLALMAPASLIFYGLALLNASPHLYGEVRYLGYSELALGLIASFLHGYGLLFWAIGFGILHIIYGAALYKKYDR